MTSVYRFHDAVALHSGNGETVYLTRQDAKKLAQAIRRVVKSIENENFVDSRFGTINVPAYSLDAWWRREEAS